jgi:hypothetical protein
LNTNIRKAIFTFRNQEWASLLDSIKVCGNKFWKTTKILKRKYNVIPPLNDNGRKIFSDQEKINLIATKFSNAHQITTNFTSSPVIEANVQQSMDELENTQTVELSRDEMTKPSEIKLIIKKMKNKKAPGEDGINNQVLKMLPRKALVYLTYLFNACMKNCYFPKKWKQAKVIAIPKPGKDPTNPGNYRPISLLNSISKVFERVLLYRIQEFTQSNNILPNQQFGFRVKHSTGHQVQRIVNFVRNGLSQKLSTGMLLLDIEKAYDSVWHNGLIHKMKIKLFPLYITKTTKSFLTDRSYSVSYNELDSPTFSINAGLPQGAALSPNLYNIFTSDPPSLENTEIAIFADDTALYTSHSNAQVIIQNLQEAINVLQNYYLEWKIKINPTKSQCIYFSKRRSVRYLPTTDLNICGSSIPWSDEVKYLGVLLDKKLLFRNHIQYSIEKTQKMFKIFYSILNRRSKMNVKNKIILYKVALRPILMYCCPIWSKCALTHRNKIQIIQNKFLKTILNLPWYFSTRELHELAKIETIDEFINKRTVQFINNCQFAENPLINDLFETN